MMEGTKFIFKIKQNIIHIPLKIQIASWPVTWQQCITFSMRRLSATGGHHCCSCVLSLPSSLSLPPSLSLSSALSCLLSLSGSVFLSLLNKNFTLVWFYLWWNYKINPGISPYKNLFGEKGRMLGLFSCFSFLSLCYLNTPIPIQTLRPSTNKPSSKMNVNLPLRKPFFVLSPWKSVSVVGVSLAHRMADFHIY